MRENDRDNFKEWKKRKGNEWKKVERVNERQKKA